MAEPRFLHRDVARGYTELPGSAVRGEPEALPESEQNALSLKARRKWEAENAERLARRDAAAWLRRLATVEKTAIEAGIDISHAQARIRGEIEAVERDVAMRARRGQKKAAA